ncbi:MAG: hypothetical protein ACRDT2_00325 [Natronosporangium sp.]
MATTTKTRPKPADDNTTTAQAAPVPTSAPPAGGPDLKVVMVATALQAHPGGITGADLVSASGLQPSVVAKVLDAMELAGAARRREPAEGTEVERWNREDSVDLAGVDVDNVPTECVCHCGDRHRRRVNISVGASRASNGNGNGAPGVNADGSPKLGKGDAERMVLAYVTSQPEGTTFTYGSIARALEAAHSRTMSTGTTRNAQEKLRAMGVLEAASADPHEKRVKLTADYRDRVAQLSPDLRAAVV